jgi:signal transduction histidine kinase/CheY-like chemotaxis protein
VHWGGTPDKVWDPTIPNRLTPRTSFELYIESSKEESRQWKALDLEMASLFFDRTMQYLHDQMIQSFLVSLDQSNSEYAQAVEVAQERYEFFAHMSHELRTPFHGIVSSLQILKSNAVDKDERKDIVESALDCGNTMLQTLDDIIAVARSRTCAEIVSDPVLISKLVRTTKRMMGPIAENKHVAFTAETGILSEGEVDTHPLAGASWDSLIVMTDITRVGQVTNNLTSNAIKFTPPGGRVTIRGFVGTMGDMIKSWESNAAKYEHKFIPTLNDSQDMHMMSSHRSDPWYIFHVEDTGCGVTGEDVKKMFDAYKQVTSGKTGAYQGTGLGLHICRSHASLMNGVLAVASSRGSGTLFFFAIPVALMMDVSFKANCSLSRTSSSTQVKKVDVTKRFDDVQDVLDDTSALFLIVDDSKVNLRVTKRKIQLAFRDRVSVDTAEDGIAAIEFYENLLKQKDHESLTGIFMDYHMPRCSGLEAIVEIRRKEKHYNVSRPVYIIAFTADLSETSQRSLIAAGANEVMAKPTPNDTVESTCAGLIMKYSGASSPVPP